MEKSVMLEGNDAYKLRETHAMIDRRVKELDRRAFLTPSEQQERIALKKMKLQIKDQMHAS
jgi:uncharacterized protein YdcH (DUF465 family)